MPPFSPESFVFPFVIKMLRLKLYRTLILPVIVCECETWPFILKEERRLSMFKNITLTKVFGLQCYRKL